MAGMTAIAASPTHNIATMRRPSATGHTVRRLATGLMNATKRMSDAIATGATIIAIAANGNRQQSGAFLNRNIVRNSQVEDALHEPGTIKNGAPLGTPRPTDQRNDYATLLGASKKIASNRCISA
jgi:hypothetical protein